MIRVCFDVLISYVADLRSGDLEELQPGSLQPGEVADSEVTEKLVALGAEVYSGPVIITRVVQIGRKTRNEERP